MTKRKQATTDAAIRGAQPEHKPYKMGAGLGMFLLVNPSGSKLWRLKYRLDGKEKLMSFGAYPEISLAVARKLRDEARELIARGIDPMEQAKKEREEADAAKLTFGEVAERWYLDNTERAKKPWAASTAKKARLYLDNDMLPALGHRPIAEITRSELIVLNEQIESRGVVDAAKKIRGWLGVIFDEAYDREEIPNNPALRLRPSAKARGATSQRHPSVPFNELPALLKAVDATGSSLANKLAIRVLLFTAVRPSELRLAQWDEFDFKNQVWNVPAERMKTREIHTVPLPTQALEALQGLKELASGSEYVLPNRKGVPISDATINKTFKLAGYHRRQTGHGFRHLLSTELNERGYNADWIEAQLAHKTSESDRKAGRGEDRKTYNHAVYLNDRATMMQEWANSITALIEGANVVSIGKKQGAL